MDQISCDLQWSEIISGEAPRVQERCYTAFEIQTRLNFEASLRLLLWAVIYRCSLLPFKIIFQLIEHKSLTIKMLFTIY